MNRVSLILAVLAAIAGCTTYKLWTESDYSQEQGTVQLSYEYRRFESPQVDERAGTEMARERCETWGFKNVTRKAEDRVCTDGLEADCKKWRVTREYRCLKAPLR